MSGKQAPTRKGLELWYPVLYNEGCAVRTYKSRWFQRFARKEGIADAALLEAVARAEKGQIDADLGGGVIKQRISRPGREDQKATGPSSSSGAEPRHSSCTGSPKASGRISMTMRKNGSRKPRSTSWD